MSGAFRIQAAIVVLALASISTGATASPRVKLIDCTLVVGEEPVVDRMLFAAIFGANELREEIQRAVAGHRRFVTDSVSMLHDAGSTLLDQARLEVGRSGTVVLRGVAGPADGAGRRFHIIEIRMDGTGEGEARARLGIAASLEKPLQDPVDVDVGRIECRYP